VGREFTAQVCNTSQHQIVDALDASPSDLQVSKRYALFSAARSSAWAAAHMPRCRLRARSVI
jgi:hypothetical protein